MSEVRDSILREMGLGPIWRLRSDPAEIPAEIPADRPDALPAEPRPETLARSEHRAGPAQVSQRIDLADTRSRARIDTPSVDENPEAPAVRARSTLTGLDWPALEQAIQDCRACALGARRNLTVPGVGDRKARWLLVGEGPGAEEDRKGEPFVGQAGKLLDAMLGAIGLSREEGVFIANAVKCRPPGNRTPATDELAACFPFLERQIELLQPGLIIALGRPAAQVLLNREIRISAERGTAHDYKGIPLIVTYHPAYLLRNQNDKAKAWADLCMAKRLLPLQF